MGTRTPRVAVERRRLNRGILISLVFMSLALVISAVGISILVGKVSALESRGARRDIQLHDLQNSVDALQRSLLADDAVIAGQNRIIAQQSRVIQGLITLEKNHGLGALADSIIRRAGGVPVVPVAAPSPTSTPAVPTHHPTPSVTLRPSRVPPSPTPTPTPTGTPTPSSPPIAICSLAVVSTVCAL